jgi:hypothetical protein
MAERAHESGFIDEPDPALLAERLRDDLTGGKVYSLSGDRFERKLDLEIDREFKAWAEMAEKEYQAVADEISAKARSVLAEKDVTIAGELGPRSARELLAELSDDVKAANILQKCLAGDIQ